MFVPCYVSTHSPFLDEISGLAIIKLLDKTTQNTIMLKVKFMQNVVTLDITNSSSETLILGPREALGILDLRSLGYRTILQGVSQQNLSKVYKFYKFESAENVCNQFNNLINILKKEENMETGERCTWLEKMDERKYMIRETGIRKIHKLK